MTPAWKAVGGTTMRTLFVAPMLLGWVAVLAAQDNVPPKIKRLLDLEEKRRAERTAKMDALKAQLAEERALLKRLEGSTVKKGAKNPVLSPPGKKPIVFPTAAAKKTQINKAQAAIQEAESKLETLSKLTDAPVRFLTYPLKTGDIGRLTSANDASLPVLSVLGDKSLLVNGVFFETVTYEENGRTLQKIEARKTVLWIKGVSTLGAKAGEPFSLPQWFEVMGQQNYQANIGPRPAFVLEPFDINELEKYRKK